ncbi:MAG: hypothetical protein M1840_005745 [Geoglossum simile]|nr:MAG: hypothetical protein M1840_005745 [Geoglossum simile]
MNPVTVKKEEIDSFCFGDSSLVILEGSESFGDEPAVQSIADGALVEPGSLPSLLPLLREGSMSITPMLSASEI